MKTTKMTFLIGAFLALSLFALNSCKSDKVSEPSPLGPSSIAVIFDVAANPNVISADRVDRQASAITATLKKYDGSPLAGKTVFFEIDSPRGSLGYFEDKRDVLSRTTDGNGTVQINYYGPLFGEITRNITIYIRASVAWEGSQFVFDRANIYVVRADDK